MIKKEEVIYMSIKPILASTLSSLLETTSSKKIGNRIKEIREEKGFTQSDLATRLGFTSATYISRLENGNNGKPFQYKAILKIAKALQCQVEEIIVTPSLEKNVSADFSFMEPLVFDYIKDPNNYPQLLNFVIEQKQLEAERLIHEAEEKKKKAEEEIKKLKKYAK